MELPDPALVVLVGASGSGKSTWAGSRFRSQEIVSSDSLRGVVGSGPHDLDASADAFAILEQVVAARIGRGLTTVVDTLGFDGERRRGWLSLARAAELPAVAVVLDTPDAVCRQRNAARVRPVPAAVLSGQLKKQGSAAEDLRAEGWDLVHVLQGDGEQGRALRDGSSLASSGTMPENDLSGVLRHTTRPSDDRRTSQGLRIVLQVSRFPWGDDPAAWLRDVALAADEAGFAGIALMDHLIQIPQVGRVWEPIPEPWVSLGLLAGLGTGLSLGTLVTPVTFRRAGIIAKAAATLDVLTGGRAFVGIGAGWWEREHAAFGLPFPPPAERLDLLESAIETMRALWGTGTKPYDGTRVRLPETTSYPRPVGRVPIIVGGGGEGRTLKIAAAMGDGCNLPSDPETLDRKLAVLHAHCDAVGRGRDEVEVTALDLPVVGRDRDDVWARVEKLRGRSPAAAYARRTHAGTVAQHRDRYASLAERGVSTVFLGVPDLTGPEDVSALRGLTS